MKDLIVEIIKKHFGSQEPIDHRIQEALEDAYEAGYSDGYDSAAEFTEDY